MKQQKSIEEYLDELWGFALIVITIGVALIGMIAYHQHQTEQLVNVTQEYEEN